MWSVRLGRDPIVLVIEDHAESRDSLAVWLVRRGFAVEVAGTAAFGLDLARSPPPDFVILDIGLPDADGLALATTLREEPGLADVRIVIVSGFTDPTTLARIDEANVHGHVRKPIDLAELADLLGV